MCPKLIFHRPKTRLLAARERLFDLLLPARCLSCGEDFEHPRHEPAPDAPQLCNRCFDDLNLHLGTVCRHCASRVPEYSHEVDSCPHCTQPKLWFDQTIALGPYEGRLRKLVLRMKQDKSETIAATLGKLLCRQLSNEGQLNLIPSKKLALVVPIPMHPIRQLTRGTNSAAALAKTIGRQWRLPVALRLLKRRRNTLLQKGLSKQSRFTNLRGGISIKRGYPLESHQILLVDDIMTTGATCSEAARVLKRAGAPSVTVLAVARTPA